MKKRILALFMAGAMAIGAAACGEGAEPVEQKAWNPVGEPNEFGWVKPEETLHITYYQSESGADLQEFLRDEEGGKAYYDAWLLENMNVVIEKQLFTNDETERLNLMLADGSYPEVIVGMPDDMANKFAAQGKAVDLTPYLDKIPNMTRRVGDYMNMLYTDDGKLYKLPNGYGENPNVCGWDFGIRYDLWSDLGLELYTTPEEYYEALKAVQESYPVNANGDKTYALSATNGTTDKGTSLLKAMLAAYGFTSDLFMHNKDTNDFTYWLRTDEGKEISLLMNKMWREGMIDPDYLSNTYDDYIAKMSTERILGNLGTWWYAWVGGHEVWSVEEENWNPNKRFMNVSVAAPGLTTEDTRLLTSNFIGTDRTIITDKCEQVEAVLAFIDWQNTELGNMITGWGPPDPEGNWWIDEEGGWVVNDNIMNVDQKNIVFHVQKDSHGGNAYTLATNINWLKTDGLSNFDKIDPRVDRVSVYDYWPVNPEDGTFSDPGVKLSWGNYTAPAVDNTLYNVSFDPEAAVTQTRQGVVDTLPTWWANIMTADSEEACLTAFEESLASAEVLGLEELEAFYKTSYETLAEKMGG